MSSDHETQHASGTHVALVSGGKDSTAAAHAAVRFGPADLLVYLDTGTGLTENREYVETLADALGVQLWTLRTEESYAELVREHGFPGPSRHFLMYQRLKERQLCKLAAVTGDDLHLWTGIRRFESDRRMSHVEPEGERGNGRWYWHAPLCDWHDGDPEEYITRFDLPRNPLWETLGRSGDCYCGAYGNREELLDLRAVGADDRADSLESLESETDTGTEKDLWAWASLAEFEQRAARAEADDGQTTLCSTCGLRADGGETDEERRERLSDVRNAPDPMPLAEAKRSDAELNAESGQDGGER